MRNLAMLVVLVFATFGFAVCFSMFFFQVLFKPGVSYPAYFGLVTLSDCVRVLAFAGWAYLIARIGLGIFSGPKASWFQLSAVGFVVIIFLQAVGLFIPENFGTEFMLVQLGFALVVALAAWAGLRARPSLKDSDTAASANPTPKEPGSGLTTPR